MSAITVRSSVLKNARWAWWLRQSLRFLNGAAERVQDREVRAQIREIIVRVETILEAA